MKYDSPHEIKELLRIYDIPPGISASIIPLREAGDRGIAVDLEEPERITPYLEGYDALFSTGLSKDYVDKREFDLFVSIRELLQNALDEEELTTGDTQVQMEVNDLGTWISDRGRGIKLEGLRMGESNKECWMRGYFGEGLKLAASYLTLHNIPVYLFTKRMALRFVVLPKDARNPGIFILLGKATEEIQGTKILLSGYRADMQFMRKMVRFWNDDLKGKLIVEERFASKDCPKEMPSAIFDFPDLLYIRNMYVGAMSQVTKRRALLSYDLWWVRLDVSRKLMTQTMPQVFLGIAHMLECSETSRKRFAEKLVEAGMLKKRDMEEGIAIEFSPIFSVVEGHLFVYAFPKGMLDAFVNVLGLQEKKDLIRRVASYEEGLSAVSQGLIPMFMPYELSKEVETIPSFK
jgi:hypothetical protein